MAARLGASSCWGSIIVPCDHLSFNFIFGFYHGVASVREHEFVSRQARLLLLAALSGEHILFIGPPGTAKSELGRRLSQLYQGTFFERLLTRFSVPEVLYRRPLMTGRLADWQICVLASSFCQASI